MTMAPFPDVSAWPVLPLDPADDEEVEREVAKRLAELVDETVEEFKEWPGLEGLTGRQALAYYESMPIEWWIDLWSTHPNEAKEEFRTFARLSRKYRAIGPLGEVVRV